MGGRDTAVAEIVLVEGEISWNAQVKLLYEESIKNEFDYIREIGEENKVIQRIRENHINDENIVMLCREILFYNARNINEILSEIEDDKRKSKELG